jgi:hypothetical protein
MRGRKVPSRIPSVLCDRHHSLGAVVLCEQSAALRSSAAGSFRVFAPLPPQAPSEEQSPSTPRYGFAVLYLAAIPPHLRRGKPRRKCSGRPGCGRPGRWRRHCQFGLRTSRCPNCQRLRGSARISGVASYPYSSDGACSREPLYPALTSVRRSQGGPSRPRPGRPSSHTRCRSWSASGSLRSPRRWPAQARKPQHTRPPPRPRSTSFRALWHWKTCRRLPHRGQRERRQHLPPGRLRLQDFQHHRPARDTRPGLGATSTGITRPKAGKKV